MAKLTTDQINELKEKGFITQVIPSADLADNTVDELKIKELVTATDSSENIESAVTIPVSSITLDKSEISLTVEGTETLVVTVEPEYASHKEVSWVSSDEAIATVDDDGKVTGVAAGNATITASAGDKSATCEVSVSAPAHIYSFGGLQIAQGPLCYGNNGYEIKDSWNYESYGDEYGKETGSSYFSFIEMGELFEKADFSQNDSDIDNLLDPFNGWRLPTRSEWHTILTSDKNTRTGSTVNGYANKHYAFVRMDINGSGYFSEVNGMLVFPDGENITCSENIEDYADKNSMNYITVEMLNDLLAQGCVFLPAFGQCNTAAGDYSWDERNGYYWSSTSAEPLGPKSSAEYLLFEEAKYDEHWDSADSKSNYYFNIRLVKPIE